MLASMFKRPAKTELPDLVRYPTRPAIASDKTPLAPEKVDTRDEYLSVAAAIGFSHQHIQSDLRIEEFKAFLRMKDWAVFPLQNVIAYMNEKAAKESAAQSGWHWRPLREKDHLPAVRFGTAAWRPFGMRSSGGVGGDGGGWVVASTIIGPARESGGGQVETAKPHPAVDYYEGAGKTWHGNRHEFVDVPPSAPAYDKLVPLHALRKVQVVEAEYRKPVSFFVCDYAPQPHIQNPDPFLMAVVSNARLGDGVGRFVIDFWDEPGFGLEQQLGL